MNKLKQLFSLAIIIGLIVTRPSWSVPVDLELQLLVDISSSIDTGGICAPKGWICRYFQG